MRKVAVALVVLASLAVPSVASARMLTTVRARHAIHISFESQQPVRRVYECERLGPVTVDCLVALGATTDYLLFDGEEIPVPIHPSTTNAVAYLLPDGHVSVKEAD